MRIDHQFAERYRKMFCIRCCKICDSGDIDSVQNCLKYYLFQEKKVEMKELSRSRQVL